MITKTVNIHTYTMTLRHTDSLVTLCLVQLKAAEFLLNTRARTIYFLLNHFQLHIYRLRQVFFFIYSIPRY